MRPIYLHMCGPIYSLHCVVHRELHHHHVRLIRERRELEGKVREWQDKVHQAMTLKFGRVVDLDRLGCVVIDRTAEELRDKLRKQEIQHSHQLADLQVSLVGHILTN